MAEPKLLTEAEARKLRNLTRDEYVAELRERGLIAPEPIDPDLPEAREIVAQTYNWTQHCFDDGHPAVVLTLAALKRGKELAQPKPLTREMVAAAWEHYAVNGPHGVDGLHAALMEQMK